MQITSIAAIVTLVSGVLLIVLILLQRPQTDSAGAFSSEGGTGTHTRRGAEKTIFKSTIIVSALFALSSLVSVIFGK